MGFCGLMASPAVFKLPNRGLESCAYELTDHEWAAINPFLPISPVACRVE
jgi:hypothetical protein